MINTINSTGGMDPTMMQEMRDRMFARADQDGDGSLSKAEFQAMTENAPQGPRPSMDIEEIFDALDTNKDGVIDQEELEAAHGGMKPEGMPGEMPMNKASGMTAFDSSGMLVEMLTSEDTEETINLLA